LVIELEWFGVWGADPFSEGRASQHPKVDGTFLDSYAHRAGRALTHKNLALLNLIRAHDLQLSVNPMGYIVPNGQCELWAIVLPRRGLKYARFTNDISHVLESMSCQHNYVRTIASHMLQSVSCQQIRTIASHMLVSTTVHEKFTTRISNIRGSLLHEI